MRGYAAVDRILAAWRTPKTPRMYPEVMEAGELVDYDALEEFLRALAYGSRLELVRLLHRPRALADIRLTPRQVRPGENPARTVSRQTLQAHLDKLVEVGLVVAQDAREPGRRGKEYAWNPQRFYQVLEEFRKVGVIVEDGWVGRDATVDLGAPSRTALASGPKLMLVRGLSEGQVFPLLQRDLHDGRGWIIGRKPDLHVSLTYDPFVSLENAEILPDGDGGFAIVDLRTSKNGTTLNWRRLDKESGVNLVPGDVIGVGRSALVFRAQ